MKPEVGTVVFPPLTSCHWLPEARERCKEINLIGLSPPMGGGGVAPDPPNLLHDFLEDALSENPPPSPYCNMGTPPSVTVSSSSMD